jgi:transposase
MDTSILYVGLDYHQKSVRVCAMNKQGKVIVDRDVANDWGAIKQSLAKHNAEIHAAIESCCGSASMVDDLVTRAGWSVDLAHPGYVNRMKPKSDKTDSSDAMVLADLVRVGYLPKVWLAPEAIRELRRLNNYRSVLANQRRAIKLRIGGLLRDQRVKTPDEMRRWTKAWREWICETQDLSEISRWIVARHLADLERVQSNIKQVEERLRVQTLDDPLVQRMISMRGIGLVTACYLRGSIGRFDRFQSGKQLSRFCGLSPRNVSSGARQADAGLIQACDRTLRALLIESAHRLVRYEPRWAELARNLRSRGKHPCLVAAAVANRWVRCLWHEMKPLGVGL